MQSLYKLMAGIMLAGALVVLGQSPSMAASPAGLVDRSPVASALDADAQDAGSLLHEVDNRKYRKHRRRMFSPEYSGYYKDRRYRKHRKSRKYHKHRSYRHHRRSRDFDLHLYVDPFVFAPPVYSAPRRSYGGQCSYWYTQCTRNWSRPQDIQGCMNYYGC